MSSSRKSFALVTLLSMLGALIAVMLLEQHAGWRHECLGILLVIFLFSRCFFG